MIPLRVLDKVNWKPCGKDSPFEMSLRTFLIHGQNSNINKSSEEADFNPHGWVGGVQLH